MQVRAERRVEIRERVVGCVLVNPNLRALSVYILVVLFVSTALRSVVVTNSLLHWTQLLYIVRSCSSERECCSIRSVLVTYSLLPLQSFIGHNCCIWYVVVVLLVSAALRSVACDQLSFTLDTTAVYRT